MSDDNIAIRVEGLHKKFSMPGEVNRSLKRFLIHPIATVKNKSVENIALKDIDFEIKQGEFFGIVGRNGSGKSTLLKILAGIYTPTKGRVRVNGKLVPFIELGVGFNPELTGRENIYLSAALLGFDESETAEMYDEIVAFAELEEFMEQRLKNYSSGMQVRLAFSIAIRAQADILLLDEVLAVGDEAFQRKCFGYFRELKKDKKTVILVSHDMDAIKKFCDRAALIEGGKVSMMGAVIEVTERYRELNQPTSHSESGQAKPQNRWGDRTVVFDSIKTDKKVYGYDDKKIIITAQVKANADTEEIVAGVAVVDQAGRELAGHNNEMVNQKIKSISKGLTTEITWSIPNIFSVGKYHLNLGINNGDKVADRYNEATSFTINKKFDSGFIVSPDIKMQQRKR